MYTVWRILRFIFFGAIGIATIAVAVVYGLAYLSLPKMNGRADLPGLDSNVEILRDAHGIPRVFADSELDATIALGYLHATDRLWQMEMTRRIVQGRLSERFGAVTLETDKFMRALDLDSYAEQSLAALSGEALSALNAYSTGVNARLEEIRSGKHGRGAPEFYIFGGEVEAWTAADSLGILKAMAFQLSQGSLAKEVRRGQLGLNLAPDQLDDLFPKALQPGTQRDAVQTPFISALDSEESGGSNAWAVSGELSASRAPILANDPHLSLTAPGIWYPVQLSWNKNAMVGASLAGVPTIIMGHNGNIAWGLTASQIDTLDVFIERLDPDDPTRVRSGEAWEALELTEEKIQVKGEGEIAYQRAVSRHGPIIPVTIGGLASVTPANHLPAISWTALTGEDTSFEALFRLNKATSVSEALEASELVIAPSVNVALADNRSIALATTGRVPLRRLSSKFEGKMPAPGWTDAHDWMGWLPPKSLPRSVNPASGIVANANNVLTDDAFPRHLSHDWAASYRYDRIMKLLNARGVHSVESFRAMQTDSISEMARSILPLLFQSIADKESEDPKHPLRSEALSLLRAWNGDMSEHLPEPLIFNAWLTALTTALTADELGPKAGNYGGTRPLMIERVYTNANGAGDWCDDIRTAGNKESCTEIALSSLDSTLTSLSERYGQDIALWRWGKAHSALHYHTALGNVGYDILGMRFGLDRVFNINHETSGAKFTINQGSFSGSGEEPFQNTHGAGYRAVYDLSDLDRSLFIVSTGASGHPLSPLYDNLSSLWRTGELVSMSTNRRDLEAGASGRLNLIAR